MLVLIALLGVVIGLQAVTIRRFSTLNEALFDTIAHVQDSLNAIEDQLDSQDDLVVSTVLASFENLDQVANQDGFGQAVNGQITGG